MIASQEHVLEVTGGVLLLEEASWPGLAMEGQLSQASPQPSASKSFWAALATQGQLSCPGAAR